MREFSAKGFGAERAPREHPDTATGPRAVLSSQRPQSRDQANARTIILLLVFFLLGIGVSAYWFYHGTKHEPEVQQPAGLSDSTKAVLERLDSPVEIRFYSMLDPATAPEALKAYAGRVEQLVAEYEAAGGGKLTVKRFNFEPNSPAQNAAFVDGIKPFDMDKGEGSYFGIVVARNRQKEVLPYLDPEWEQALEADLTRAIARAGAGGPQGQRAAVPARGDPAAADAVKRLIPNLDSVSVEEGTRILREAALAEFTQATQEMEAKLKAAQERFLQAQKGQSEADQQAAMKELQQVQADQADKLKEIAAQSQAQVEALKRLKQGQ